MSSLNSTPARGPIETKVKASTLVALLASLALALLNGIVAESEILGSLPPALQFVILTLAPTLAVFLAGYSAPHTRRSNVSNPPLADTR